MYFHIFRTYGDEDWFEKFVSFACTKARIFYGLPPATSECIITEDTWGIPKLYKNGSASVIPMYAGMTMPYSCKSA